MHEKLSRLKKTTIFVDRDIVQGRIWSPTQVIGENGRRYQLGDNGHWTPVLVPRSRLGKFHQIEDELFQYQEDKKGEVNLVKILNSVVVNSLSPSDSARKNAGRRR